MEEQTTLPPVKSTVSAVAVGTPSVVEQEVAVKATDGIQLSKETVVVEQVKVQHVLVAVLHMKVLLHHMLLGRQLHSNLKESCYAELMV